MPLRPPNLDDRDFDQLVEEARRRIAQSCPDWTDLSMSDPGMVLLDAFAHLTEIMIYRLNRIPEKAYVEFLRLIGVQLRPPAGAVVTLRFTLSRPQDRPYSIPRGTRVTAARGGGGDEPPIFSTARAATIPPGRTEVEVPAVHCELIEAELAGTATGQPGLVLTAQRAPIIAPTGFERDLVVGVEADAEEAVGGSDAIRQDGKTYRIWREVEDFTAPGADAHAYLVDRLAGTITFAPAARMSGEGGTLDEVPRALAEIPVNGREVRLWYRAGGGVAGNVTAHALTVLKDPLPGVSVTNPAAAAGGRAAEGLANALVRGPQELHSLRRAVTARDLELVATATSGAVDRAHAYTKATLWTYATPGTAEVLLVPHIPEALLGDGPVTLELLRAQQSEEARERIQHNLDLRRPVGTTCLVDWAKYKTVRVTAEVVVNREEDPVAVERRLTRRLHELINPLPDPPERPGWSFGQPLTAWHVYSVAGSEPGVRSISRVRFAVEDVPNRDVGALAADTFQPNTWYAGSGDTVFRTLNDGQGWESVTRFSDENVTAIRPYPGEAGRDARRAGLVAVVTRLPAKGAGSRVYISRDCAETWEPGREIRFLVNDMAWLDREGVPTLMLATEKGLYSLASRLGATPVQVEVDAQSPTLGFNAIAVSTDIWGQTSVAVAAQSNAGIFLSSDGGRPNSFANIGLKRELVRVLAVQHHGPHRYLWAGIAAIGEDHGKGCFRWVLTGSAETPEGWVGYHGGWQAGGCRSLTFHETKVFAATLRRGVLVLDLDARAPAWEPPKVDCGLPLRDLSRLQPVDVVAANPGTELLMAAGREGVYRSPDLGRRYTHCSSPEFSEEVTLPRAWLFCSGPHELKVVGEDEAG